MVPARLRRSECPAPGVRSCAGPSPIRIPAPLLQHSPYYSVCSIPGGFTPSECTFTPGSQELLLLASDLRDVSHEFPCSLRLDFRYRSSIWPFFSTCVVSPARFPLSEQHLAFFSISVVSPARFPLSERAEHLCAVRTSTSRPPSRLGMGDSSRARRDR